MRKLLSLLALALLPVAAFAADDCPELLRHELRRLNSDTVVDLCQRYGGKPLLIVNTASHCGYTPQFKELETLHQRYRERGLVVLGFPSDDFRQEAKDEQTTAEVCYINYGVSFDMFAPIGVRGKNAHPLFRALAAQSEPPRWNFHKFVVGRDGRVIAAFPSKVKPTDPALIEAIESAL